MTFVSQKISLINLVPAALLLFAAIPLAGQDQPSAPASEQSTDSVPPPAPAQPSSAPSLASYAVAPGTRFLVLLEDELTTSKPEENRKFKVRTAEPIEAANGTILPPGTEIRGHVSRVEPAGVTGRARLWLTFDEIKTPYGKLPIVADVVSVPGDHSVKSGPSKEGEIEGRKSTQRAAAEAAAGGAAIGAVHGVKHKDAKEAAEGAAMGALAAYLMESGRGQELNLPKGAKLELELGRPLYLMK